MSCSYCSGACASRDAISYFTDATLYSGVARFGRFPARFVLAPLRFELSQACGSIAGSVARAAVQALCCARRWSILLVCI